MEGTEGGVMELGDAPANGTGKEGDDEGRDVYSIGAEDGGQPSNEVIVAVSEGNLDQAEGSLPTTSQVEPEVCKRFSDPTFFNGFEAT